MLMMEDDTRQTEGVSMYELGELWAEPRWQIPTPRNTKAEVLFASALTTARNMLAISQHLVKIQDKRPGLHLPTYRSCELLLNLLGFVHEGLEFWRTKTFQEYGGKTEQGELRVLLENLEMNLLRISPSLSLRRSSWDIPAASAIWLLIEVVYKTEKSTPTTIGEN